MDSAADEGDRELLDLAITLRLNIMRLTRRLRSDRPAYGLSLTHIAALGTIDRFGPIAPHDLAERERVSAGAMTRVLSVLSTRGLIARRPHPADRRQYLVVVEPAGLKLLADIRRVGDVWVMQHLLDLTPPELEVLGQASKIIEKMANEEPRPDSVDAALARLENGMKERDQ